MISTISYSQTIVAYKNNDLSFGDVFIGYSENVEHTDPRAAKFNFYHTKFFFADLLLSFNLPKFLTNGKDKLPIEFDFNHAAWSNRDRTTGRNTINPNTPNELRRLFFYLPVYVWLGGKIQTNSTLSPGNYNGTITITIEYL
ncbi:MAG: hypothetical protein H6609_20760 [Ignavibacteriales bacterium]|nr:hypothetical protein [Ignavibacteriales bacterium]